MNFAATFNIKKPVLSACHTFLSEYTDGFRVWGKTLARVNYNHGFLLLSSEMGLHSFFFFL